MNFKEKKMKKLAVALFVALLGLAFTAPAFALENQFGGYWRVRMFNQTDFDGRDNQDGIAGTSTYTLTSTNGTSTTYTEVPVRTFQDHQEADTRTRLYYTAVINDNLKFVNKFEMDATWGNTATYGDLGADNVSVEVKNSYVDFNLGMTNWKIGTQGAAIQRSFLFDNDFSGVVFSAAGFTGLYAKITEGGENMTDDAALYHGNYAINLGDVKLTPNLTIIDLAGDDNSWYMGLDVDGTAGSFGYWATLIYNGGEITNRDISAYLLAVGGNVALSDMVSLHGQAFHATGDNNAADSDLDNFQVVAGTGSYYWAEIMGLGVFDGQASNGSCADAISNITAINMGVSFNASAKLTLGADLWYAMLDKDNAAGDDKLGTEIDLSAAYTITEGLRMHFVAAYLFAGDATTGNGNNDENPFEIGTQFSISF